MKKSSTTPPNLHQTRRLTAVDVIDGVLDKGIVIDYRTQRVLLSGIELPVTVEARFIVASFDTYLEYGDRIRKTGLLAGFDE